MLFQNGWFLQHGILFCPWEERELPGCSFFIFKFRSNFHWVTLVAFVMAVLQKLVLFFLQRPSWQYCAETRHPHFLLHWTGRANKQQMDNTAGLDALPVGKTGGTAPPSMPSPVPWKDSLTRGTGGAKLTQVPSKNCLFSKFEVWIFICKDSSFAHSLIKLLFSCCVVLPRPAYLCFYPALPRRSYQEKKVLLRQSLQCEVHMSWISDVESG